MPDDESGPPGLDIGRLAAYLGREAPDLLPGRPLTARLVPGGRSNLTYVLEDGARSAVLRRPPLGHVLATAHDMHREFRVIQALAATPVPVPEALVLGDDPDVLGAPFYLMQHVDGRVLRHDTDLADVGTTQREVLGHALVDVLADLHDVDPASVGLQTFGRPEGYLERQVVRWAAQLEASRSRDLPGIEDLRDRLGGAVPATRRSTVLHGDYRLDNVMVDRADPRRIVAVLDWEMATLGDPLADVGLLLVYATGLTGLGHAVTDGMTAEGFPSRRALVERYVSRSGADVSGLAWYVAFGYFKLAVILEGIHARYVKGQTVGTGFEDIAAMVVPLAGAGLAALREPSAWQT